MLLMVGDIKGERSLCHHVARVVGGIKGDGSVKPFEGVSRKVLHDYDMHLFMQKLESVVRSKLIGGPIDGDHNATLSPRSRGHP